MKTPSNIKHRLISITISTLLVGVLSSCSLIKIPEKTTGLMDFARWADIAPVAAKKLPITDVDAKDAYEKARTEVKLALNESFTSEVDAQVPWKVTRANLTTEAIPVTTKTAVAEFLKIAPKVELKPISNPQSAVFAMIAKTTNDQSPGVGTQIAGEITKALIAELLRTVDEARKAQGDVLKKRFPTFLWPSWEDAHKNK